MTSAPEPFQIVEARNKRLPIILSIPHAGREFPKTLRHWYKNEYITYPVDTDWYVDELYDFAASMGISIIRARYSRYVIDLNRDPENKPLYNDGRIITELLPVTTFLGEKIYAGSVPDADQIALRLENYFWPYYGKLQSMLDDLRSDFPHVLLWDCHSIKRRVPTIRPEPFPDLILGNQDGKTADARLVATALEHLGSGQWQVAHNEPFKGGYISRYFGKPECGTHALQLEMAQDVYMDEAKCTYSNEQAADIRAHLQQTLVALAEVLERMQ